jgi:hypothetical protein
LLNQDGFSNNISNVLMITMSKITIGYSKVSSSEQDQIIKLLLWSQHFDPKTQCSEQTRATSCSRESLTTKLWYEEGQWKLMLWTSIHQVVKTKL